MKLVIDIDEDLYNHIKNSYIVCEGMRTGKSFLGAVYNAIANSKLLPKGHGRLFDERDIVNGSYEIIGNRIYELEPIIGAESEVD